MKVQHTYFACAALLLVGSAGIQLYKKVQPLLSGSVSSRSLLSGSSGSSGRSDTASTGSQADSATAATILDRVEPLCRALVPEQETLHFRVTPQFGYLKTGQKRSMWWVECLDTRDRHLAHVLWDATSDRIVMIGRSEGFQDLPLVATRHTISSTQALDRAREWAHTLHLASKAELETSSHTLLTEGDIVCVRLFPPAGEVLVWVSRRTGTILNTHAHNVEDHPAELQGPRYIANQKAHPPHA